jgi:DNA (cytosine-5)-methyltransferase 1
MMLRTLDLFSGIGGFSLGLERTRGFKTVAFCEIEAFPRKVLAKHWPEVPCYHDVRELTAERLAADGIAVDVICGGFPCQDISVAGTGVGLAGKRSGLWSEFSRLIGELRPQYAIVENVSALLSRGLTDVLGDLATLGYDAEWHCIPASAIGAPHRRDRIWIVAYANQRRCRREERGAAQIQGRQSITHGSSEAPAHPISGELRHESGRRNGASWAGEAIVADDGEQGIMADADSSSRFGFPQHAEQQGTSGHQPGRCGEERRGEGANVPDANGSRRIEQWRNLPIREELAAAQCSDWWRSEPDVGRVAHGVPSRVDRLKGLGNAVVPQIPELIGRAILAMQGAAS